MSILLAFFIRYILNWTCFKLKHSTNAYLTPPLFNPQYRIFFHLDIKIPNQLHIYKRLLFHGHEHTQQWRTSILFRMQFLIPIIKIQWQTKYFTHVRSSITMIYHLLLEQTTKTRPENKDLFLDRIIIIQCATFTLQWWFLPSFCVKSWSNLKPNDSFEICSS